MGGITALSTQTPAGLKARIAARLRAQLVCEHHGALFEALGRVLARKAAGAAAAGGNAVCSPDPGPSVAGACACEVQHNQAFH